MNSGMSNIWYVQSTSKDGFEKGMASYTFIFQYWEADVGRSP